MDIQSPRRSRPTSARTRQMARRRRVAQAQHAPAQAPARPLVPQLPGKTGARLTRLLAHAADATWYLQSNPRVWQGLLVLVFTLSVCVWGWFALGGRVAPRVRVLNTPLGGLSAPVAEERLRAAWDAVQIRLEANGETLATVRPQALGLLLDVPASVAAARAAGWNLLGQDVTAVVLLPDDGYMTAQRRLLELTTQINTAPYNAGFAWQDGALVPVAGRAGRLLDMGPTLLTLRVQPADVVARGVLPLTITPVAPDDANPTVYLAAARAVVEGGLVLNGYDPYQDQQLTWATDQATLASWLEVGPSGLTLRDDVFAPWLDAAIRSLNPEGQDLRYLDTVDVMGRVGRAINQQQPSVTLRIRYRATQYVVTSGDTGYRISRRTGVPFNLINAANPNRNMERLNVGDTIQIPSRDFTMPTDPLPGKRIIVDLPSQYLRAYENGTLMFEWSIASGMSTAPTMPGIYQILDKTEEAVGSSYTLCSDLGCGSWRMYWFMGIYEVVPGLVNGFHGAVLLPNGTYLGGGNVGRPATFGCVMSENSNAQQLYHWADAGTVVEIISNDYPPVSQLARQAFPQYDSRVQEHRPAA